MNLYLHDLETRRNHIKQNYNLKYINDSFKATFNNLIVDYQSRKKLNTDENKIEKITSNICSLQLFSYEVSNIIQEEALNFIDSKLPIVSAIPFAEKSESLKSCILNEFAFEQIKPLAQFINLIVKDLFPQIGEVSTEDFLCFFTEFGSGNHSHRHADESHVTVSICLENEKITKEKIDDYCSDKDIVLVNKDSNEDCGEFVFYEAGKEIIAKQTSNKALFFLGNIPHETRNICDPNRKRFNLNFYFKQLNPEKNIDRFYDKIYIEYLAMMGIKNCEKTKNNKESLNFEGNCNIIKFEFNDFVVPQLPKLKETISSYHSSKINESKPSSKLVINQKIVSENLLKLIFNYLDSKSIANVELTNNYFYSLTQEIYKKQYLDKTHKYLDENSIIKAEEKNKLKEKIHSYLEEKEKCKSLNFKNLKRSLETSIKYDENSRNIFSIHLDDMNLGNSYIQYINNLYGISNHYSYKGSDKIHYQFKETIKGYFEPRSIIVNSISDINCDSGKVIENTNSSGFMRGNKIDKKNENCYLNLQGKNLLEDSEQLFEKIRKEAEQSNNIEFYITSSINPELNQISNLLSVHIQENYGKRKKIVAPVFDSNSEAFSPIFLKSWIESEFLVMQYEKQAIEELAMRQFSLFPNSHLFDNYANRIFSRAINGIIINTMEEQDLVPYPGISLIQHSFSPAIFDFDFEKYSKLNENINPQFNSLNGKEAYIYFSQKGKFDFNTGLNANDSIFTTVLHKRFIEKINCCAMNLQFFGDVLPKDIMAVVGSIKCKRNIDFVDWCPTGFKCFTEYTPENILNTLSVPRSCHMITNCNDALDFYEKMNSVINDDKTEKIYEDAKVFSAFNSEQNTSGVDLGETYESIKDFICARYGDYNEIYNPVEEPTEENES